LIFMILAYVFSSGLQFTKTEELTEEEQKQVYRWFKESIGFEMSPQDRFQIGIRAPHRISLENKSYDDSSHKLAIAMLLNKGYLRRVDKSNVEFTERLYELIVKNASDQ